MCFRVLFTTMVFLRSLLASLVFTRLSFAYNKTSDNVSSRLMINVSGKEVGGSRFFVTGSTSVRIIREGQKNTCSGQVIGGIEVLFSPPLMVFLSLSKMRVSGAGTLVSCPSWKTGHTRRDRK